MDEKRKIVLITGAAGGIGTELAYGFAPRYDLVLVDKDKQKLSRLRALRRKTKVEIIAVDITDFKKLRARLAEAGRIDILINNAGIGDRNLFVESSADVVEDMIKVNYLGAVYCTKIILPEMLKRNSGQIVNISSASSIMYTPRMIGYSASKSALTFFSRSLRNELRTTGIKVSTVIMGPTNTRFDKGYNDGYRLTKFFNKHIVMDKVKLCQKLCFEIEKGSREIFLPPALRIFEAANLFFPNVFARFADNMSRKMLEK